jgi:hypothetical protein
MMPRMKRKSLNLFGRWIAIAALALAPAMTTSTAMARSDEPEPDIVDARLEGYSGNMTLPASSNGLTWVLFVILAVVGCAGLFKDAKRSHLD